jgi:rfaE bifunctional protein kinase chain/domain
VTPERLDGITGRYAALRIAVIGDFCLDRYLDIDPERAEVSIETGLPVRNVVQVRSLPGGAGTVLNNLVALGVGTIHAIGFCGDDGEGYELRRALGALPGVALGRFLTSAARRTFTYCKPMLRSRGQAPRELERLDSKNWSATPPEVGAAMVDALRAVAGEADGIIVLDQVDLAESGVVTAALRSELGVLARGRPELRIIADSRRGLRGYPPVIFKMNAAELAALTGQSGSLCEAGLERTASELAGRNRQPVFITRAELGMVGATGSGEVARVAALPVRGAIDVVGAGDSVTANLTAAMCAGASMPEAMELAMLASSLVIHQLGTTGTASVAQIRALSARSGPR